MATIDRYGPPLERAIQAMRDAMAEPENVAKPDWSEASPARLWGRATRQLLLLERASLARDATQASRRAANVANYAWMLADLASGQD